MNTQTVTEMKGSNIPSPESTPYLVQDGKIVARIIAYNSPKSRIGIVVPKRSSRYAIKVPKTATSVSIGLFDKTGRITKGQSGRMVDTIKPEELVNYEVVA